MTFSSGYFINLINLMKLVCATVCNIKNKNKGYQYKKNVALSHFEVLMIFRLIYTRFLANISECSCLILEEFLNVINTSVPVASPEVLQPEHEMEHSEHTPLHQLCLLPVDTLYFYRQQLQFLACHCRTGW